MSDEIDWTVYAALHPSEPEGEGSGPVWICECGQRTRVATMATPLNEVDCKRCGRKAVSMPNGRWEFA